MKVIGKLNLQSRLSEIDNGDLAWAKNVIKSKDGKAFENEPGFDWLKGSIYANHKIIGQIEAGERTVILTTDGTKGAILIFDGASYQAKLNSQWLNWSITTPIIGEFRYNINNDLIVALGGENVTPMLFNIDKLDDLFPSGINSITKELNDVTGKEINLLNWFPKHKVPVYGITILPSGGTISYGVHYFLISYVIGDNDYTNWVKSSGAIPILNPSSIVSETLTSSTLISKSIRIVLSNLDTSFGSFRLAHIHKVGTSIKAEILGDYKLPSSGIRTIFYRGQEGEEVSVNELVIDSSIISEFNSITSISDRVKISGIRYADTVKYQKWANNITVKWISSTAYSSGSSGIHGSRGLPPGDVVALYAHLIFTDGSISKGFHIPGREPLRYEDEFQLSSKTVPENSALSTYPITPGVIIPTTSDESAINVAAGGNLSLFHLRDTAYRDVSYPQYGIMGYWKNYDELYPVQGTAEENDYDGTVDYNGVAISGGRDLTASGAGTKNVLHHKVPDFKRTYISGDTAPRAITPIFNNVVIPSHLADVVVGICFSFAKRNVGDMQSIDDTPILHTLWYNAPSGAFQTKLRTYPYSLLHQKPEVKISHIEVQYEKTPAGLIQNVYGVTGGYYTNAPDNRVIFANKYIPANNSIYQNEDGEEYLELSCNMPSTNPLTGNPYFIAGGATSFVATLKSINLNPFHQFSKQELHILNGIIVVGSAGTYTSMPNSHPGGDVQPSSNVEYLVDKSSSPYTKAELKFYSKCQYFPESRLKNEELQDGIELDADVLVYKKNYDITVNVPNDVDIVIPYDIEIEDQSYFPFRIHRSVVAASETTTTGWRRFLPSDYYDIPVKNKGRIYKLLAENKTLYIQCERALFVATVKDVLRTDEYNAYLGVGDLFDREPDEILQDDGGVIGCVNRFASIISHYGYIVVDSISNKIFIVNKQGVAEISLDIYDFLVENLNDYSTYSYDIVDNPYNRHGLCMVVDDTYERLILTKIDSNSDKCFTISFHLPSKSFVGFHDYTPSMYAKNRRTLYAIFFSSTGYIVRMNSASKRGEYLDVIYPSYIDVVINKPSREEIIINTIEWITEVISVNGNILQDKTITSIMVYNDSQCTEKMAVNINSDWFDLEYGKGIISKWTFNNILDAVVDSDSAFLDSNREPNSNVNYNLKDWFDKSELINIFAVIRLEYDNQLISGIHNRILIKDLTVDINKVDR